MGFNVINTQKHLTEEAIGMLETAGCRLRYVDLVSLDEEKMCRAIAGIDGVIAGSERYSSRVFAAADRLKVIARTGVGIDRIDLAAASRHGVYITNTPGATSGAVAEFTIGVILCLVRGIPAMSQSMKAGQWHPIRGRQLGNMVLGIVGAGSIGKHVIMLARGFGTQVLAYDIHADEQFAQQWDVQYVPLDDLLRRSDIVSVHCSLNVSTRGLIGPRELDLMMPGSYLVNTARPYIVDYDALVRKLEAKEIAGAAIDVHDPAPCGPDDRLVALDNVLPTCWSAYNTREAIADMSRRAAQDLIAVLQGRKPRHPVNCAELQPAMTNP
jgi:phosphoglycerate dehydrogenase-like enzyme